METIFFAVYNSALILLSPFILFGIFLRYPKTFLRSFFNGLDGRLGGIKGAPLSQSIWIHAASLGECRAAAPLVRAFRKIHPETPIAFSCTTATGVAEAKRMELGDRVFMAPIDLPWIVHHVFKTLNPRALILLESELWPNWLGTAASLGVPIGIVNGRMSARSASRYLHIRRLTSMLMSKITFLCAREQADADRFASIGFPPGKITITGQLKFDLLPWDLNGTGEPAPSARLFPETAILWVAGSVRNGEDNIVLDAFVSAQKTAPALKLILAPRHFETLAAVQEKARALGLTPLLKSKYSPEAACDVLIWDSFGDLWKAYQECDFAFVGGSLVGMGGQNPIEPAWFGKPVLFGPSMENFAQPAQLLINAGGAAQVKDADELGRIAAEWAQNKAFRTSAGDKARKAMERLSGRATKSTLDVIEREVFGHA